MPKIKGGYILQPRAIDEAWIAKSPPHIREIWLYLLRKANHADCPKQKLHRGQLRTSYSDIIEDLSWTVGYRKESYKRTHCETAMRALTREGMITTAKSIRGMVVTVCKYDHYQNPKNYEVDSEVDDEVDNENINESTRYTRRIKNDKNDKNTDTNVSTSIDKQLTEDINYENVISYFNKKTNGVFGIVRYPINENRRKAIRARIREHGKEALADMINKAIQSDFLKGDNKNNFTANFDWLMKPSNFQKTLEGNYNNKGEQTNEKDKRAASADKIREDFEQLAKNAGMAFKEGSAGNN